MDFPQLSKKYTLSRRKFASKRIWIGSYPNIGDVISTTDGEYVAIVIGEPAAIMFGKEVYKDGTKVPSTIRQEIITSTPNEIGCIDGRHILYSFMFNPWDSRYMIINEAVPPIEKSFDKIGHKIADFIVNLDETLFEFGIK